VPINNLHEAGVDPLREARVFFDQWPMLANGCGFNALHHLHGMRIAHRYDAGFQRFVGDVKQVNDHVVFGQEGNFSR
jgi:hypothetical protein